MPSSCSPGKETFSQAGRNDFFRKRRFAKRPYLAARRQSFADDGDEDSNDRGPSRASIIRFASATISSVRLFSRLEGLSANARVDPGAKIAALQPFPTGLTSIRYPLYSMAVIVSAISIRRGPLPKHHPKSTAICNGDRGAVARGGGNGLRKRVLFSGRRASQGSLIF
jgi:hypothetical protein